METKEIIERMREPATITPRETKDFYIFLSSEWACLHDELSKATRDRAMFIALKIAEKHTARTAELLADAQPFGQSVIGCKAQIKGLEEVIRALKRSQDYFSMEATNHY